MLDQRHRPPRVKRQQSTKETEPYSLENHPLLQEVLARRGTAAVPRRKLAAASTSWMLATFGICYLAIPFVFDLVGLRMAQWWTLPGSVAAFSTMWVAMMAAIVAFKPDVRLDGRFDPVVSATAGGLLTWGILHNVLPGLTPFVMMPTAFLVAFIAANVLENALFGAMLASMVKTRRAAFALGAAFQGAFLSLAWFL